jgi:hypothetical protein
LIFEGETPPLKIPKISDREEFYMSTQEKARALMTRHYHLIKNRQQSMLERMSEELNLPEETSHYWSPVQGKISTNARMNYDRSNVAMS